MFIPLRDENPTERFPLITLILISANVLTFFYQAIMARGLEMAVVNYGAIPYNIIHFWSSDLVFRFPPLLTIFTSMFLHGSVFHLAGNMLYLWIFGNNVEDVIGPVRFVVFYLACGLIAAMTQVLMTPASKVPMIGASGAVAGVLGGYLLLFPRARVKTLVFLLFYINIIYVPAGIILSVWFIMQLLNIGLGGGVAWFAHIGGFLAGFFLLKFLFLRKGYFRH